MRPAYATLPLSNNFQSIVNFINTLLRGKLNIVADVTLNDNDTTTTVLDARISAYSFLALMPLTESAKNGLSSVYYTDQKDGKVIINHASSVETDLNYRMIIIG